MEIHFFLHQCVFIMPGHIKKPHLIQKEIKTKDIKRLYYCFSKLRLNDMQIKIKGLAMILTFLAFSFLCQAQDNWNNTVSKNDVSRTTIKKKGYTLTFVNKDSTFPKEVEEHLIKTFFKVYPKEVREYNRKSSK